MMLQESSNSETLISERTKRLLSGAKGAALQAESSNQDFSEGVLETLVRLDIGWNIFCFPHENKIIFALVRVDGQKVAEATEQMYYSIMNDKPWLFRSVRGCRFLLLSPSYRFLVFLGILGVSYPQILPHLNTVLAVLNSLIS